MQFRRIVIAVDGSPTSLAALEATGELAAAWGAEVIGLFIEDTNLLRMASLPFAKEVGSHSGAYRALNLGQFERELRTHADRARNTIWFVAERLRMTASFSVARGSVKKELLKALRDCDMLSMGKGGSSVASGLGLGTNAKAVAAGGFGIALLFSHVASVSGPPAVVYDGSPASEMALIAGGELAATLDTALIVLCPVEASRSKGELQEVAKAKLTGLQSDVQYRQLVTRTPLDLARNIRSSGANLAIIPTKGSVLTPEAIETLLSRFSGPVMLVGERDVEQEPALE